VTELRITVEDETFVATMLDEAAPKTAAAIEELLPYEGRLLHVRWSGIATWINIDEIALPELPRENHTVYPSRGDLLLYPGFRNEQEILFACGPTCFKSPAGELAGNHFATVDADRNSLKAVEERTLEEGALDVRLEIHNG